MKVAITLDINGFQKTVHAQPGALLSDVLRQNGVLIEQPCGGKGTCGKCLVYVNGATCRACQTVVENNMYIKVEDHSDFKHAAAAAVTTPPTDPMYRRYGIAFDIGTTTVCAALLDANGVTETVIRKNPQTAFGADVISRIEKALLGEQTALSDNIQTVLNEMIATLCGRKGISAGDIDAAVIVGNTAMLYLLTGHNPEPLSHAPFKADRLFDEYLDARALHLSVAPNAQVYIPPCISAFIGADITAAILASDMCSQPNTALLADIGTNGEIVLWHNGILSCCSTAAGPAFEGAGISQGTYGTNGAIDSAWPDHGRIQISTIGGGPAIGICGSGMIDILAAALKLNIINETGAIESGRDGFKLQDDIKITSSDIRNIQLAKSAIRAGMETLLAQVCVNKEEVETLYISGGFGSFINLAHAAAIGLIPAELLNRSKPIGNAAHTGASMFLRDQSRCAAVRPLVKRANTIALDANPFFEEYYIKHMIFE